MSDLLDTAIAAHGGLAADLAPFPEPGLRADQDGRTS